MGSVLVIAAESSAAQYASSMIEEFRNRGFSDLIFFGIGDQAMIDNGFLAVARAEEMAVMGFSEILPKYFKIRKALYDVLDQVDELKPSVAVVIDYPGFNLRLIKQLKARGVAVCYYVSPQIWAWKKGRIKAIQAYVDHMLVLFPFEKEFYKKYGVKTTCVGHPFVDSLDLSLLEPAQRDLNRSRFGIRNHDYLLGLMPGSRGGELKMHMGVQIATARKLHRKYGEMKFAFLVAPTICKESFLEYLDDVRFPYIIIQDDPVKMISLCESVLAASGTATLQVGLMKRPMVIMYRMTAITAWIARRLVKIPFFGLVNMILGREAVPERFQKDANADELFSLLVRIREDREFRDAQLLSFEELHKMLEGGATGNVVDAVSEMIVD